MLRDPRTYAIIGCAMAVHRKLGHGHLEKTYQQALAVEFQNQGIPFQQEVQFDIIYDGVLLPAKYRGDFVCFGEILVELKAQLGVGLPETHQMVNYLRITGLATGLLLNFGLPSLQQRRYVFTHTREPQSAKWRSWGKDPPLKAGARPKAPGSA